MLHRLAEAQNWRCAYCGYRMWASGVDCGPVTLGIRAGTSYRRRKIAYSKATLDHVVPRSLGGGNEWENLVAACSYCNSARSNFPAEQAFDHFQRMVREGEHPHATFEARRWIKGKPGGLPTVPVCEAA